MPTKIMVLLVLFLAVVLLFVYSSSSNFENTEVTEPLDFQEQIKLEAPQQKQPQEKSVKQETKSAKQQDSSDEIIPVSGGIYDSDPVVDANLILKNNMLCINHLNMENRTNSRYKSFERQLNATQKQFHKQHLEHCKKLNQNHPDYNLSDYQKLKDQLKQSKATSYWGQIIKGEVKLEDLSEYEISQILKQNDLNILLDAPNYLEDYYLNVVHWQLEDVLQNHQYDYTRRIRHYAHRLYLCNLGADCSPNSSTMATLCYLNSQGCGLNYYQYIQNILTPGQQADLQLATEYLQGIYQ